MIQPLSDITVIDASSYISGPFCTKYLADMGATVIKVESPHGGDVSRRMSPFYQDTPSSDGSGVFLFMNANKQGITLDFDTATGRRIFRELIAKADVFVEDFHPDYLPSLGLSYDDLAAINDQLIVTSITPFGQTGPYIDMLGDEIVLLGMGGPMIHTGNDNREPTKYAGNISLRQAGVLSALATSVAIMAMEARGTGEHVDVSVFEVLAGSQDRRTSLMLAHQHVQEIFGRRTVGGTIASGIFPCKNGYVNISGGGVRFAGVCSMIGQPELLEDERFSPSERLLEENAVVFNVLYLETWLAERTMLEVWQAANKEHVLAGVIYTTKDLLDNKDFQDRGVWQEIDHPDTGPLLYPGRPYLMSESPWSMRRPAPKLGQHNEEIYCGLLGYTKPDLVNLYQVGVI